MCGKLICLNVNLFRRSTDLAARGIHQSGKPPTLANSGANRLAGWRTTPLSTASPVHLCNRRAETGIPRNQMLIQGLSPGAQLVPRCQIRLPDSRSGDVPANLAANVRPSPQPAA
jgi:hypothetical protein